MEIARKGKFRLVEGSETQEQVLPEPISHVTGLSRESSPCEFEGDYGFGSIIDQMEEARFTRLCGTQNKRVPLYSAEVLIHEALPPNFPIMYALDRLIDSLDAQNNLFANCEAEIKKDEAALESESPLSQRSQKLNETYRRQKEKTLGYFKKRTTLSQFNAQRAVDEAEHIQHTQHRIKINRDFQSKLALKITLHECRIRELIEEYFEELAKLSTENQELIKRSLSHCKILFAAENLGCKFEI